MCTHTNTVQINNAKVCLQCGMTFIPSKPPFFDKKIVNYDSKKERKRHGDK